LGFFVAFQKGKTTSRLAETFPGSVIDQKKPLYARFMGRKENLVKEKKDLQLLKNF